MSIFLDHAGDNLIGLEMRHEMREGERSVMRPASFHLKSDGLRRTVSAKHRWSVPDVR